MNAELANAICDDKIPTKIKHHKKKILKHENAIKEIQENCNHPIPYLNTKYESDTGNWCKADDFSFTIFKCSWCEKTWTEDGQVSLSAYYVRQKL